MKLWLIQLVVHYVLTMISAATGSYDWDGLVKTLDADVDASKFVPGFLKGYAKGIIATAVAVIRSALGDSEWMQNVATNLENGNMAGALKALEDAIVAATHVDAPQIAAAVTQLRAA